MKTDIITRKEVEEIVSRLSAAVTEKRIADYIESQKKAAPSGGVGNFNAGEWKV